MHRLRILILTLTFFAVMAGGAQNPQAAPPLDAQLAASAGADLFAQSGSTGMVLVIVRGSQVFFKGYGETAPGSHQLPTENSTLRLCSLTKIFTADVLSKLAANGTVRLDDPLARYAPAHIVVPSRVRPIRLIDLATHSSGLPRELRGAPLLSPHFTFPDYNTRWRWLPNQHPLSVPGTAALYSNIAFDLLSDALQTAARQPYAALLAKLTLNPLQMTQTTLFPNATQCSHLLAGSDDQGPCTSTEATAGSSGLYSTASDMAIWLKYLLRSGETGITSEHFHAQAVYLQPANLVSEKGLDHAGEPTGVGLGWIHILPLDEPSHIIEKTGGGAGFQTYIALNHARDTALFLAATDGPPQSQNGHTDSHLNLYNAANKLLLAVCGLPPLPPPTPRAASRHRQRGGRRNRYTRRPREGRRIQ